MPNGDTFSVPVIGAWVRRYLADSKCSVDPFARNKRWATHTNDLNPATEAEHHMEARDFLRLMVERGVRADRTWEGRQNERIGKLASEVVEEAAEKYRQAFPAAVARVTTKFRADENNREGPHFVLLGYSAAKGAPCAAMTVYAASAGRDVVEANGVLMFHDLGHPQVSRAEAVQCG